MRKCFLAVCLVVFLTSATQAAGPARWDEILGPSRGRLPAALPEVKWRSDLGNAMEQATRGTNV